MEKHHDVSCVVFENDILTVSVDGRVVRVPARNHPQSIRDASEAERTNLKFPHQDAAYIGQLLMKTCLLTQSLVSNTVLVGNHRSNAEKRSW